MRRLPVGGAVDRSRPLAFRFDDRSLTGYPGDTLASALLANGISIVGSSVSLGRPRGVMSAGLEEAHAFVQLGVAGATEPLVRATTIELFDGLVARSRSTKGVLSAEPDPARSDKRHAHCDVLVIGGGPAGLSAAAAAAGAGARVILAEARPALGGALHRDLDLIDGRPHAEWIDGITAALAGNPDVRILRRTTAVVALDQNGFVLLERVAEHLPPAQRAGGAERRLWHVRAREAVIATGALERPIVFPDNDRPGIMLASAVRTYLHEYGVGPGRTVLFTATDDGYRTALDLTAAGEPVAAVVDPRPAPAGTLPERARAAGIQLLAGAVVTGTEANRLGALQAVTVSPFAGDDARRIECATLAVSGGWDPALDLVHQIRGRTRWSAEADAFVPDGAAPGRQVAGAATGSMTLHECLRSGHEAGVAAARAVGLVPRGAAATAVRLREEPAGPLARVAAPDGNEDRSFVDLHRDATVAGVERALGAGIRSVEHLKRYTLIGTGVEQGKTAKVPAGRLAGGSMATSSARPPVEPVSFAALAGRARGHLFEPVRTTPLHSAHAALGAVFQDVGQWKRARYFPRPGESMAAAVARECRAVRGDAGIMDASTLGKIDVQGPDAAEFLERLYVNRVKNLKPGRARYGAMCGLDGILFDDGVILRLAEDRFFVTTSTSHAGPVMEWMEEWLQTEWLDLRVWLTSVTEQFATVAVAGPQARTILEAAGTDLDLGRDRFPFMAVAKGAVASLPAQVARVSFSGELAFEVSVAGFDGPALWAALMAAGAPHGITPYGLETVSTLRAEKGYLIVGQDTDAATTPHDAGLGWMIPPDKPFVGKRSLARPAMTRPDRKRLVGFLPDDPAALVREGAQLVADPAEPKPMTMLGHVTTSHRSEALGRTFGLALVRGGPDRIGERLFALDDRGATPVTLADPVFYDPEGTRRDG